MFGNWNNMALCLLCESNLADKKGSHIVPHFLLKRIENVDGKKSRDVGVGFSIGELETKSHFERSVPTKNLDDIFGDLSDEDIRNNKVHPLVRDNIFCSLCENRLAAIEDNYSNHFQNGMLKSSRAYPAQLLFLTALIVGLVL